MIDWRHLGIGLGLRLVAGAGRARGERDAGLGAVLMLHRVLPEGPDAPGAFAPNRGLQVTPAFLDAALAHLVARGRALVPMDEVPERLAGGGGARFVAITLDDGARCLLDHALPVFERHRAPFAAYLTPGFLDRAVAPWWLLLEAAVARLAVLPAAATGLGRDLPARTPREKARAFAAVRAIRDRGPEAPLRAAAGRLAALAGADARALTEATFLSWDEAARLAAHPLATIGAHTLTHPRLAELTEAAMREEVHGARAVLEARLGVPVRHLAYPYGDAASAGPREGAAARGFATAVTTRGGVVAPGADPLVLPRVTVNGHHQSLAALGALVSGAPYALAARALSLRARLRGASPRPAAGPPSSG